MNKSIVALVALASLVAVNFAQVGRVDAADSEVQTPSTPVPSVENGWTLKKTTIAERSPDGSYQQLLKYWEHGGMEGLTLSVRFLEEEAYIVCAWKKGDMVESAAQPQKGEWVMVKISPQQFQGIINRLQNSTAIVPSPSEGFVYRFPGVDGSEVKVPIHLDHHRVPQRGPKFTI